MTVWLYLLLIVGLVGALCAVLSPNHLNDDDDNGGFF